MLIQGYAAVFGIRDRAGDIIVKGAFSRWIAENLGKNLSIFWSHDHMPPWGPPTSRPIGVTTEIAQTEKGLWFAGITAETPKAQEIATLIDLGAVNGSSIGYGKYAGGVYRKGRQRYLTAIKPAEITIANWGVNPHTYVESKPQPQSEEIANVTG